MDCLNTNKLIKPGVKGLKSDSVKD